MYEAEHLPELGTCIFSAIKEALIIPLSVILSGVTGMYGVPSLLFDGIQIPALTVIQQALLTKVSRNCQLPG